MGMTLVMTDDPDKAVAARSTLVPERATAFLIVAPTACTFAIFCSATTFMGSGSIA